MGRLENKLLWLIERKFMSNIMQDKFEKLKKRVQVSLSELSEATLDEAAADIGKDRFAVMPAIRDLVAQGVLSQNNKRDDNGQWIITYSVA